MKGDVEIILRAAALMRERATEAICTCGGPACTLDNAGVREDEMTARFDGWTRVVDHYVGMSPAVAVVMADWLEVTVKVLEARGVTARWNRAEKRALIAAQTYLGSKP